MINSQELVKYTKNLSIIFVEDHDELRENTSEILKNFFKDVEVASNGKEALEKYQKFYNENSRYHDIVLSDIQMPIVNGIELTKSIYNINSLQTVIILSAFDDTHYLLPLINLGIEQFVKKPIDFQELLRILLNTAKKLQQPADQIPSEAIITIKLDSEFTYNRENHALFNKKENIYLTKYEILFMQTLTNNLGKIYSNEEIVANYTSLNENLDTQNIRKLVSKLRKKLPKDSLESIYGIGYRIIPYIDI